MQHPTATWPHDAGYRGLYINLDRSPSRRASVERQLSALGLADIYARLPAVDGRTLPPRKRFNPGIVGCFRSQTNAVGIAAASALPVHIVEDDVVLSPHVAPFIRHAAAGGLLEAFDVVFLDMWVDPAAPLVSGYLDAVRKAGDLRNLDYGRLSIVDLRQIRIGAAASYVMAPAKARKLHALLEAEFARGPNMPFDHCLSRLCGEGAITAAVVVPFLTGIDLAEGAVSQTLTLKEDEHRLFLLLRSAFFVGRDLEGTVLPGLDRYRRTGRYPGLDQIHKMIGESAGLPAA